MEYLLFLVILPKMVKNIIYGKITYFGKHGNLLPKISREANNMKNMNFQIIILPIFIPHSMIAG